MAGPSNRRRKSKRRRSTVPPRAHDGALHRGRAGDRPDRGFVHVARPGHLEGSTRTSGTVVEYQKHIALLDLASGEQVRLYSGPNPVKAGDVLPLVADTYSNGTVQYRVDFKAMGVPAQ